MPSPIYSTVALAAVALLATAAAPSAVVQPSANAATQEPSPASGQHHRTYPLQGLTWRGDPNGVSTAIAEGDPSQPGLFTMMLRLADGAWIPPHFHNVDKRLVVVRGALLMGQGKTINKDKTEPLEEGGIAVIPKHSWHFEGGRGETVVALIAEGPFQTTFAQ